MHSTPVSVTPVELEGEHIVRNSNTGLTSSGLPKHVPCSKLTKCTSTFSNSLSCCSNWQPQSQERRKGSTSHNPCRCTRYQRCSFDVTTPRPAIGRTKCQQNPNEVNYLSVFMQICWSNQHLPLIAHMSLASTTTSPIFCRDHLLIPSLTMRDVNRYF